MSSFNITEHTEGSAKVKSPAILTGFFNIRMVMFILISFLICVHTSEFGPFVSDIKVDVSFKN